MEQAAAGTSVEGSWGTSSNAQQPPTAVAIRKRLSMTAVNAPPPSAVQPYLQGKECLLKAFTQLSLAYDVLCCVLAESH
jgi:hypothetical protein